MAGYKHRSHHPPFWLLDPIEKDWNWRTFGIDRCFGSQLRSRNRSVAFRHDTSRQKHLCVLARLPWKFQGKWSKLGEEPCVFWKPLLRSLLFKAVAMFYVPSGTPSTGSSDSGDGAPLTSASRNLSSLLDEQRKRGIGAALLTITGTSR